MNIAPVFAKLVYCKKGLQAIRGVGFWVEDNLKEIIARGFTSIFKAPRILVVSTVKDVGLPFC
jgi:hypothetical protein